MGLTSIYGTARAIIETGKVPSSEKELVELQKHLLSIQAQLFSNTTEGMDIVPFEPIVDIK